MLVFEGVAKMMNCALRRNLIDAAYLAGREAIAAKGRVIHVDLKGAKDLVTDVDRSGEERFRYVVRRVDPKISFWGEEGGKDLKDSGRIVIVDPLDATTNFLLGFPLWSIIAAYQEEGRLKFGLIYIPELGQLFTAEAGEGAFLNRERLSVRTTNSLASAVVSCNRSNYPDGLIQTGTRLIELLIRKAFSWRNMGTAGVEYAWTASGKFDGVITPLAEAVHAAGYLIMQEAGAKVTDHLGNPISLDSPSVVAANSILHEQLLDLAREAFSPSQAGGS
ncbi:inositol monophosphatase [Candidatus Micrarchaeota archaeon]|nr:inositol monophosphatase [Candidatus Micrarchaeota archaeon]